MSRNATRLELTWIGKDQRPKLEPRILLEDPSRSYHAPRRVTGAADAGAHGPQPGDLFDNRLIFGDNLLALKALEAEFTGKIKCVYIDPPFNTGEMFAHYDDGLEHSLWLSQMRDRLTVLRRLLSDDGTLFVHIDDNELGYLVALLDELFGRSNRLYVVTFKQGSATGHKSINPGCVSTTNFVLIYARDRAQWAPNRVFTARDRDVRYNQFIVNRADDCSEWRLTTLSDAFAKSRGVSIRDARALAKNQPELLDKFVLDHADSVVRFARPDYSGVSEEARTLIDRSVAEPRTVFRLERADHPDFYMLAGQRILFYAGKVRLIDGVPTAGEPLTTLWDDLLSNNLHAEGGVAFPKGKKPEALLKRVLEQATNPGDWILDSFAGSGTTGAVAHKMGRRWIMVELGEHCHTHIIPRLRRVIDGEDPSGATAATGWTGGGGFRYYRLAPSLLAKDRWDNWVISSEYNPAMLAEAICKLEGFVYAPSETVYWQHGHSTESDFIYVTTQPMTHDMLVVLSEEVGPERTLLVLCKSFTSREALPNLTVKKIPKAVMAKCEWGQDDYSLQIRDLPLPEHADTESDAGSSAAVSADDTAPRPAKRPKVARGSRKSKADDDVADLFGASAGEGTR